MENRLIDRPQVLIFKSLFSVNQPRLTGLASWVPPKHGMIKVNTDAAVRIDNGVAIGGVATDYRGMVCWCYAEKPKMKNDVDLAETYAVFRGLQLAKESNCSKVILETDSQRLFYAVSKPKINYSRFGEMVDKLLCLSKGFDTFRIYWIRRVGNSVAHALASFAYSNEDSFLSTTIPDCCLDVFEADFVA
ncbi:hypothetical protein ACS0TY_031400 [Phlomoides rotata]